jgi:hypothetical protein
VRLEATPLPGGTTPAATVCTGGSSQRCFEPGPSEFINVGSFFDRLRRTLPNDYMIKYFLPDSPGRYQIQGFSFVNSRRGLTYPGGGVVTTPADAPNFPTSEQLSLLQVTMFEAAGPDSETCVNVGSSVIVEAGQAAWLVVHMPADTAFVGLRADRTGQDHPCDFMTRDAGDYWYRPDPNQSPYDWQITPHFVALPGRPTLPWTTVKRLYR